MHDEKKSVNSSLLTFTYVKLIHAQNSFLKIQNTISYICRFIHITKNHKFKIVGPISTAKANNGHTQLCLWDMMMF